MNSAISGISKSYVRDLTWQIWMNLNRNELFAFGVTLGQYRFWSASIR